MQDQDSIKNGRDKGDEEGDIGKPFTISNESSSITVTAATYPDPYDPKDLIVLVLSGVTCAQGGDPMLNGILDDGSSKSLFNKGEDRL